MRKFKVQDYFFRLVWDWRHFFISAWLPDSNTFGTDKIRFFRLSFPTNN